MFKIRRVKVIEIGYKYMYNGSVCLQALNQILNALFVAIMLHNYYNSLT